MKLITAYTVAAALLCQTASVSAIGCSTDNIELINHQSVTSKDMAGILTSVQNYGGLYRVSGTDDSIFATSGAAKMTLTRTNPKWPTGSTHLNASTIESGINDIIKCCQDAKYGDCYGNTDERGDQGDTVNIVIIQS